VKVELNRNFTNGESNVAWAMQRLREAGLVVLPAIADASGKRRMARTLADPALRGQHVADLVALAVNSGYDGLDLDYENFAFSDGRSSWAGDSPELDDLRRRTRRRAASTGQVAVGDHPRTVQRQQ
jgi:hypothetical protein